MAYESRIKRLLNDIERDYRFTAGYTGKARPDQRVMDALEQVQRHAFISEKELPFAYENFPLPIGYGQTISQPFIVALMTDMLHIEQNDVVLEVGTGCGYQTAVLSLLAKEVYSMEIIAPLADSATERLRELGYRNVTVRRGDGYFGWPEMAPFDKIIVTATADAVPPPLLEQLAAGGRMIIPLGESGGPQQLTLFSKNPAGKISHRFVLDVAFVPLTGDHGAG